jgi:hypothetical protein
MRPQTTTPTPRAASQEPLQRLMMLPLSLVTPLGRNPRPAEAPQPLRTVAQVTARLMTTSACRFVRDGVLWGKGCTFR